MSEKVLDAIVGHAPASVGRGYGEPTLADKAKELQKFPRYSVRGNTSQLVMGPSRQTTNLGVRSSNLFGRAI